MDNSYEVGDFQSLGAAAHKFKSSISYLGNPDLPLTKRLNELQQKIQIGQNYST